MIPAPPRKVSLKEKHHAEMLSEILHPNNQPLFLKLEGLKEAGGRRVPHAQGLQLPNGVPCEKGGTAEGPSIPTARVSAT